jgi:hypothetical protein
VFVNYSGRVRQRIGCQSAETSTVLGQSVILTRDLTASAKKFGNIRELCASILRPENKLAPNRRSLQTGKTGACAGL